MPASLERGSMACRSGCGACCIAPSISSPMPGAPYGKPAGQRCPHLMSNFRCELFGQPQRPAVCSGFLPEAAVCGDNREQALQILTVLEQATAAGS